MYRLIGWKLPAAVAAALLVLALATAPGRADDDGCGAREYESGHDHEKARRALECGEVMSLEDVLAAVRPHIAGRIIETEFEKDEGVWVYELKFIDRQGRMVAVHVDARTGQILNTEGGE